MGITFSNRFGTLLGCALFLCAPAVATGLAGPAAPVPRRPAAWSTGEQFAAARQASAAGRAAALGAAPVAKDAWLTGNTVGRGLRWVHGGAVNRVLGKVYFSLGAADYVCSGAVVRSPRADVVLTAAHCVSDGAGHWATDWTFVPDYRNGAQPYGAYTARRYFVDPRWAAGREQYDIAFVQVNPAGLDGRRGRSGGVPATRRLPPGLPVAFAAHPAAVRLARSYVFGYPSEPPFSGQYPNYCAGRVFVAPGRRSRGTASVRTRCGMTAGDSGGPWLAGFLPRSGTGVIVGVTTFKLSTDLRILYGAVLGPAARHLYLEATRAH